MTGIKRTGEQDKIKPKIIEKWIYHYQNCSKLQYINQNFIVVSQLQNQIDSHDYPS